MVQSTKEDFETLEGIAGKLDLKRLGRQNTIFFFACDLEDM